VKLQNSWSNFSVYSTTGEQLKGDLPGYNELARQFDKKRIAFYFEASDKDILLGTRLIVQIIGGREERAIFIKKYSLSEFSMIGDFINSFYVDAKTQVENLTQIKYQVLGLLKEGDLPIQERSITLSTISAIIGKILIQEPVKIKIEDLSISFGTMRKIIESFNQKNIPNYKIAIAQYPVDTDILISPNIAGSDLEILNNGQEKIQPIFEKKQLFFQAISEIYDQQRTTIRTIDFQDRNKLSRILKNSLLESDILNDILKKNPKDTQDILHLYQNDTASLYQMLGRIFRYNKTLYGVDKEFIALIVNHIIESIKNPSSDDREILKIGYYNLGNDNLKDTIQQYLISQGIFEEYFLKDLVKNSIKNCQIQLLKSVIQSQAFNDQILQTLNTSINLHNFEQKQVLDFIEIMFKSNFEKESKGHQIYLAIIRQYQNQQFDTKKLNQLQDRYGQPLIPLPHPTIIDGILDNIDKKTIIMGLLLLIAIIGLIVSTFSYFGLFDFRLGGIQTNIIQNASNNSVLSIKIINDSYFDVNGTHINRQDLNKFVTESNATSLIFIYNNTTEEEPKSLINNNVNLSNFIDGLMNTTS